MKKCTKCKIEKELICFGKQKRYRDGFRGQCKSCQIEYSNKYSVNNKELLLKYAKEYYQANKCKILENKKKHFKERRKIDPLFKLKCYSRNRTRDAFRKKGYNKNTRTQEMLGVNWEFCKSHIERQFTTGMSWDNQGDWHIDHIIPLASAVNEEELKILCNYLNLQPLWAKDNLKKSDKYNEVDKVNMVKKIKDSLIQKVSQVIEK